jgi:hypothetical protein
MKPLLRFLAISFVFFSIISCSNNNDDDNSTPTPVISTFAATLTPPAGVTSTAYGSSTLVLNQTAKTFEITVNFTGLAPIHGHIHAADGTILFPFPDASVSTSPIKLSFTITDPQMVELLANHYYVNLHTTAYPAGEISGTLMKTGTTGGGGGGY